jgi:hypothetical protein
METNCLLKELHSRKNSERCCRRKSTLHFDRSATRDRHDGGKAADVCHQRAVPIIAAAAQVITTTVVHPSNRSKSELVRFPITLGLLVSRITIAMSGGASNPLRTADQQDINSCAGCP